MRGIPLKTIFVLLIAAVLYYVLTFFALWQLFGNIPGLKTMQDLLGRPIGDLTWAHAVHALALLLAGIPSALLLSFTFRNRAVRFAALSGALTAAAGLNPALLVYRGHFYELRVAHISIDSIKFVLILMLLTWLAAKLPSNYAMQRSSRVGTPLAGTGPGEDGLRSASNAPTARPR